MYPNYKYVHKNDCFKMYHAYHFNNVSKEELSEQYRVDLEEINKILNGENEYIFLRKPDPSFKKYKPTEITVTTKDGEKITFWNNQPDYYMYLQSLGIEDPENPTNGLEPYNPMHGHRYRKLDDDFDFMCESYKTLYDSY